MKPAQIFGIVVTGLWLFTGFMSFELGRASVPPGQLYYLGDKPLDLDGIILRNIEFTQLCSGRPLVKNLRVVYDDDIAAPFDILREPLIQCHTQIRPIEYDTGPSGLISPYHEYNTPLASK